MSSYEYIWYAKPSRSTNDYSPRLKRRAFPFFSQKYFADWNPTLYACRLVNESLFKRSFKKLTHGKKTVFFSNQNSLASPLRFNNSSSPICLNDLIISIYLSIFMCANISEILRAAQYEQRLPYLLRVRVNIIYSSFGKIRF